MAYIEKEPITKFITDGLNNPDKSKAFGHDAIEILTEIEYAPTADVVEVVRCGNCKTYNDHRYCTYHESTVLDSDFCSYGERKKS